MAQSNLIAKPARVYDDLEDANAAAAEKKDPNEALVEWVKARTDSWRDHRRQNYEAKWDEYERLWRGIWASTEKNRQSERSKIVTPALSEAVENSVAELEEAIFGRGDFFDFKPEAHDPEEARAALEQNKNRLKEDLARSDFAPNVAEALVNSAVYGTGIGEIVLEDRAHREIVPGVGADGAPVAEVREVPATYACLRSVNPRNFLIDPNARTIAEALGVAVEERVGLHIIRQGIESGDFNDVEVTSDSSDTEILPDKQQVTDFAKDATTVLRYYGLVPKELLFPPERIENLVAAEDDGLEGEPTGAEMVEAIIVIASGKLLKAAETPMLMKDRPIVAFPWDIVPGRFWGRGVCEKGNVPQKMLDAEMRSRIDALAYSSAPMIAMDAGRLPRGFKFEVAPGKTIPTAGDPSTALKPFTFGQIDQSTWQQAAALDQMVQRATGALDGISLAQRGAGGEARSGAVSMALSGVAKRYKRTMMNFTDRFFIPALEKMLYRYMQFAPDRYIPLNSSFVATSTTGIMQREYETQQLVQLLSTMQPQSREYKVLLMGVIAHTGLADRKKLTAMLEQSIAQDEAMAQAAMAAPQGDQLPPELQAINVQLAIAKAQLELAKIRAEVANIAADTALKQAQTRESVLAPEMEARELALKGVYNTPEEQMQAEFDRRLAISEQMIAAQDIASNERIAHLQSAASVEREKVKAIGTAAAAKLGTAPPVVKGTNAADVVIAAAGAQGEAAKALAAREKARAERERARAAEAKVIGVAVAPPAQ